ncbi:MAG: hypothetical protein GTN76_13980 [Candidatus Aenigmarchaeota archaeon]|nr:hypothetical protein [Candidatus Aenigmarchaeota archaeon]
MIFLRGQINDSKGILKILDGYFTFGSKKRIAISISGEIRAKVSPIIVINTKNPVNSTNRTN